MRGKKGALLANSCRRIEGRHTSPRKKRRPSTPWKRWARGTRPAVRTASGSACADLGFPAARLRHSVVGQTERSRRAHLPSASEPGKTWRFPKCAVATVAVPRSSLPHLRFSAATCLFVCLRRVFRRATVLAAAPVVGLSSLEARTFVCLWISVGGSKVRLVRRIAVRHFSLSPLPFIRACWW